MGIKLPNHFNKFENLDFGKRLKHLNSSRIIYVARVHGNELFS
jgi:hypothetical protein